MNKQRWKKVERILEQARDLPSQAQASLLDHACGQDEELRKEVVSLLAIKTEEGAFFEHPVLDFRLPPGSRLGHYTILKELGQGGMGKVFLAEQTEPIQRKVAIKFIVTIGMDTISRQRFEVEQQLLARMNHSYIAKLYECCKTSTGHPFFVMEYIEGTNITRFCNEQKLSLSKRILLFTRVCEAVSHAHLKGIIHRDLKPSNILIGEENNTPIPKVIDFGIAKSISNSRQLTRLGDTPGTFRYMSPEQTGLTNERGRPFSLDWRTDVYSLGVILYELLTGVAPLFWARDASAGSIYSDICNRAPKTPSLRWRELEPEPRLRLAALRDESPAKIGTQLQGDLGWIVMKAIEKLPEHRYHSPNDLLADLKRYAQGQPVSVGPPGLRYILGKFIKRHLIKLATATVFALLLFSFTLVITFQKRQTARARDSARQERNTSEQVTTFLIDMFEAQEPERALGAEITAKQLLDRGTERIAAKLKDQPEIQARLMDTMGQVYYSLGFYKEALPLLEQALVRRETLLDETHLDLASSRHHLAEVLHSLARYDQAEQLYDQALKARKSHDKSHPRDTAETLIALGLLHKQRENLSKAEKFYKEAREKSKDLPDEEEALYLVVTGNLAALYRAMGDNEAAEPLYREALALSINSYGEEHLMTTTMMNGLGIFLHTRGDYREAEQLYRKALAARHRLLGDRHPWVAISTNNLGGLLYNRGQYQEAEGLFRRALKINSQHYGENHHLVQQSVANLYRLLRKRGDLGEAKSLLETTLAATKALGGETHPNTITLKCRLAQLYATMAQPDRAENLFHETLALSRNPRGEYAQEYVFTLSRYAQFLRDRGAYSACESQSGEAISLLGATYPKGTRFELEPKSIYADCVQKLGRFQEAEAVIWQCYDSFGNKESLVRLIHLYQDWNRPQLMRACQDLYCLRWGDEPQTTELN